MSDAPASERQPAPGAHLRATLVGLFPEAARAFAEASILGRAQKAGLLEVVEVQIRDFADDKHRKVDDTPAGGGPGMILRADRTRAAIDAARARGAEAGHGRAHVVLLGAAGRPFRQADARRLAQVGHLVLVCGRYEGIDARVPEACDEELSIGDYVLTGGELAALVVLDACARLLPGVLGNEQSAAEESFEDDRLEHRQYTRPTEVAGLGIPAVLSSGNHPLIAKARARDGLLRTRDRRPDLLERSPLNAAERNLLDDDRVPSLEPEPTG